MKTDQDLIFEAYAQYAPQNAPEDDQFEGMEPEEGNENYSSEGAVNLLEQLKQEVPELEDKINQILEQVFDAVDILKQESYINDPQLRKAYDSLIEGDF